MGYNTSSIAESMNRMIKSDSKCKKITLKEFRIQFDAAHKRAGRNNCYLDFKKQYPLNFPFTGIIQHVSKTCVIEMYKNIQKSLKYSITPHNGGFIVKHHKNLEETSFVEILEENITCTCNQTILFGIPCAHITNVLLNVHPRFECVNLIHKHWKVTPNVRMNLTINENEFQNLPNTIQQKYNDNVLIETSLDVNMNTQKRYCKILFLGKQLARIGSLATEDMYDQIINNLYGLISVNLRCENWGNTGNHRQNDL